MNSYYALVVSDLLRYREYRQRIVIIEQELDTRLSVNMGIDYKKPLVQTSNQYDSTVQTVISRLDSAMAREYTEKKKLVDRVRIALDGLDPKERFVIERKYLSGRKDFDVSIYSNPEFSGGRSKYYEIKDKAVAKLARILGYKT